MAAPIARVRLARPRLVSLAETAPFRKSKGASHEQFGPFVVHERLGEGGMAYVDRAEMVGRDGFRKLVALKRMRTEWTADPEFIEAFVHEAQLASRLTHPNIAQAYELGKIGGTYFIAMELVQGPNLSQIIQQSRRAAGPMPLAIVLEILIQLCDALDHAHELRDAAGRPLDLVHRDISPSNVIVSRDGIAKLIDFGIAKARSARRSTQVGIIKGKHAYIAPEYTYGRLDRRADIWGLGVIAHELLSGRRLFVGVNDAATIRNVRTQPIPPPSRYARNVSQDLDDIVITALQRDPDSRFQNAGAMRVALTTEMRRLRMAVSGAQIRAWVEWAFQQKPRSETTVDDMLDTLDATGSGEGSDLMSSANARFIDELPTVSYPTALRPPTPHATSAPLPLPAPHVTPAPHATLAPSADELPTVSYAKPVRPTPVPRTASAPTPVPRTASAPAPRPPRWSPPTRWMREPRRRSASPFVLLALVAFAALAVANGWIDVEAWRALLA